MNVNDATKRLFDFGSFEPFKQVIIILSGIALFFGTITYGFWQQHLRDDQDRKERYELSFIRKDKRIEKLETVVDDFTKNIQIDNKKKDSINAVLQRTIEKLTK